MACTNPAGAPRDASADASDPVDAAADAASDAGIDAATPPLWRWTAETVDGAGRADPSIAVGPDGVVQVAYYAFPSDLRWATNAGGAFAPEIVDDFPDTGGWSSVAIVGTESRIAYHDYDAGRLVLARGSAGDWTTETLDTGPRGNGRYTALAIDAKGAMHVGFARGDLAGSDLAYATDESGAWTVETVDADGRNGEGASITIDDAGTVHLAYIRRDVDGGQVRHASRTGGAWTVETIPLPDGARDVALASATGGGLHLVWSGVDDGALHHATDGDGWTDEAVDDSGIVRGVALAIGEGTACHVAYHRAPRCPDGEPCDRGDLVHATDASGAWQTEIADAEGATGFTPAIAIAPDGALHVAYVEMDGPSVKHARGTGF